MLGGTKFTPVWKFSIDRSRATGRRGRPSPRAGGEPQETVVEPRGPTSAPVSHASTDALSLASTEELLLELRRRIIAPHQRRRETWDDPGGLDPHGDWPEEG